MRASPKCATLADPLLRVHAHSPFFLPRTRDPYPSPVRSGPTTSNWEHLELNGRERRAYEES